MDLFCRISGDGFPVIILHGLYGSSDNWITISNKLSKNYKVIVPDLRNHGQSPHDDEMDFKSMTEDISELLKKLSVKECILMGHSMGGKLAMHFAMKYMEMIQKLIVVDVAPKSYMKGYSKHFEFHKNMVNIMSKINVGEISTRSEIENELLKHEISERTVKFLLKNLKKNKNSGFQWKINVPVIHRNLYKLIDGTNEEEDFIGNFKFINPALFIKGEKSDYILEEDISLIKNMFSNVTVQRIQDAGHWVHAEKIDEFLSIVTNFIHQK